MVKVLLHPVIKVTPGPGVSAKHIKFSYNILREC